LGGDPAPWGYPNIFAVLIRARVPADVNLPGFRLHPLKGFWSVTVRANWRVIFRFHDRHVWHVDLIDYHYRRTVMIVLPHPKAQHAAPMTLANLLETHVGLAPTRIAESAET